jgi:hypothetical protein
LFLEGRAIRFYDLWKDPTHHLILFPPTPQEELDQAKWVTWSQSIPDHWLNLWEVSSRSEPKGGAKSKIPQLRDPQGKFRERYGAGEGAAYLIRPDGYVAFRSQNLSPEGVTRYLQQFYLIKPLRN